MLRLPLECFRGTGPSHAGSSRPLLNPQASPTAAARAVASSGPTPSIFAKPGQRSSCAKTLDAEIVGADALVEKAKALGNLDQRLDQEPAQPATSGLGKQLDEPAVAAAPFRAAR